MSRAQLSQVGNTLRPRKNGHFEDDIFKFLFVNEDDRISIKKNHRNMFLNVQLTKFSNDSEFSWWLGTEKATRHCAWTKNNPVQRHIYALYALKGRFWGESMQWVDFGVALVILSPKVGKQYTNSNWVITICTYTKILNVNITIHMTCT